MNYKNQVFDITKMQHYNVGVEKKCSSLFLHLFFLKEDKGDIRGNTPADPWGRRKVYGTAEGFVFQQRIKKYDHSAFLEQLLVMLVGMADTVVVSYVGEAAVSGVSLVNQFNTIFIFLFTALASGGAVIISQYIGRKENEHAGEAASQLLSFSTLFAAAVALLVLIGNEKILGLMFGRVESDVMAACITYLRISVYSYPALAIYNAGAAIYRSIGKTSVTMYLSVVSNIINVIGNIIGVFVLKAGVAGVAYPSLIARTFSAVAITMLCFGTQNEVVYRSRWIFAWSGLC